jgi:hypothetical protein
MPARRDGAEAAVTWFTLIKFVHVPLVTNPTLG